MQHRSTAAWQEYARKHAEELRAASNGPVHHDWSLSWMRLLVLSKGFWLIFHLLYLSDHVKCYVVTRLARTSVFATSHNTDLERPPFIATTLTTSLEPDIFCLCFGSLANTTGIYALRRNLRYGGDIRHRRRCSNNVRPKGHLSRAKKLLSTQNNGKLRLQAKPIAVVHGLALVDSWRRRSVTLSYWNSGKAGL